MDTEQLLDKAIRLYTGGITEMFGQPTMTRDLCSVDLAAGLVTLRVLLDGNIYTKMIYRINKRGGLNRDNKLWWAAYESEAKERERLALIGNDTPTENHQNA